MLELARLEEGAGKPAEAIRWLDKAASLHGKDPRPKLILSGLYLRRGQPNLALDAAKAAQAIEPSAPGTLLALAEAQAAVGNGELAKTTLRRLSQVASFNVGWLTRGAAAQMRIGDLEGAEYTLSKVLLADPANQPAKVLKTRLSIRQNKLGDAEKQVQALLGQGDGQADALRLLGEVRLSQGRAAEAVDAYRRAYASDSGSDSAFGLYGALMRAGQYRDAAGVMQAWQRRNPADTAAGHALGEAWLALDDLPKAGDVYAELIRGNDKDARAHNNLANILLRRNDPAGALRHAERARALAPTQPQVNDTLGWVLVQQGQVEKGLRYLREASLRAPDDPDIRAHLQEALRRQGR